MNIQQLYSMPSYMQGGSVVVDTYHVEDKTTLMLSSMGARRNYTFSVICFVFRIY